MTLTNKLKAVISKFPLDWFTTTQALRLSIPPSILTSLIESDTWINHFTGDCYLGALVAAFSIPTYPGAKFVQFNLRLSFGFAVSYAYCLLAGVSIIQARKHDRENVSVSSYSSSAEAVLGVFIFFFFWVVFTLRSMYPTRSYEFVVPGLYGATVLPTLAQSSDMSAVKRATGIAIQIFLAGQAVGFVNGVLVFPRSCRNIYLNHVKQALGTLRCTMKEYQGCMRELRADRGCESDQLRIRLREFSEHVQKARTNLRDAQNELAWDRLDAAQMEQLVVLLGEIEAPLNGLATIADMLELVSLGVIPTEVNTGGVSDSVDDETTEHKYDREWLLELMYQRVLELSDMMVAGVDRALFCLGDRNMVVDLASDDEAQVSTISIEKSDFADGFSRAFDKSQKLTGGQMTVNELLERFMEDQPRLCRTMTTDQSSEMLRYFIFSHVHALLSFTGAEFQRLLLFIEESQSQPNRIVLPRVVNPFRWRSATVESSEKTRKGVMSSARDPDHLLPTKLYERIGARIIQLSAILCSEHSAFGVKGACAIMTISIIALLRKTHDFYSQYRLEWALFAILLSMSRTTGASTFSFSLRLFGTACSMIASYVIWYAPYQKTQGVIVLFWTWLFLVCCLWVKHPRFFSAWLVMLCAAIIMIGNELSVRKLNPERATELNQAAFPPYVLFPFRLAIVFLGIITAYFYTVFPGARSEHAELRRKIASSLYTLASYQATVRQVVFRNLEGGSETSTSNHPSQLVKLSSEARAIIGLLDWEVTLGGRFPKEKYVALLPIIERVKGYLTLQAYASKVEAVRSDAAILWAKSNWSELPAHLSPPGVTDRLIILHSALLNGHPLPPELPEMTVSSLEHLLRSDTAVKRCFAIYALIHNLTWYMLRDVNLLTELVRDLVGSLIFNESSPQPGLNEDRPNLINRDRYLLQRRG